MTLEMPNGKQVVTTRKPDGRGGYFFPPDMYNKGYTQDQLAAGRVVNVEKGFRHDIGTTPDYLSAAGEGAFDFGLAGLGIGAGNEVRKLLNRRSFAPSSAQSVLPSVKSEAIQNINAGNTIQTKSPKGTKSTRSNPLDVLEILPPGLGGATKAKKLLQSAFHTAQNIAGGERLTGRNPFSRWWQRYRGRTAARKFMAGRGGDLARQTIKAEGLSKTSPQAEYIRHLMDRGANMATSKAYMPEAMAKNQRNLKAMALAPVLAALFGAGVQGWGAGNEIQAEKNRMDLNILKAYRANAGETVQGGGQ